MASLAYHELVMAVQLQVAVIAVVPNPSSICALQLSKAASPSGSTSASTEQVGMQCRVQVTVDATTKLCLPCVRDPPKSSPVRLHQNAFPTVAVLDGAERVSEHVKPATSLALAADCLLVSLVP